MARLSAAHPGDFTLFKTCKDHIFLPMLSPLLAIGLEPIWIYQKTNETNKTIGFGSLTKLPPSFPIQTSETYGNIGFTKQKQCFLLKILVLLRNPIIFA